MNPETIRKIMPKGSRWRRGGGMPLQPLAPVYEMHAGTPVPVKRDRSVIRTVNKHTRNGIEFITEDGEYSDIGFAPFDVKISDDGNRVTLTPKHGPGPDLFYERVPDA